MHNQTNMFKTHDCMKDILSFVLGLHHKILRLELQHLHFKGRVHCFAIQVVMNKCFLQNPEKI